MSGLLCSPSVPIDALVSALHDLFEREPSVRAGYLVEVHRGSDLSDVFLLIALAVTKGNVERMVQLTWVYPRHHGIPFYGT